MKHLYPFLFTAFSILTLGAVSAQNFVYAPSANIEHEVNSTTLEIINMDITTPTPEDITFAWEITAITFPQGWQYSICDYTGCYASGTLSAEMAPLTISEMEGGIMAFLKLNLTVNQVYGEGILEFYVYDSEDYSRGDTVVFDISHTGPTAVSDLNNNIFKFGPNPVRGQLTISFGNPNSQVSVMDLSGKVVFDRSFNENGIMVLDFSELTPGVYLMRVTDHNGSVDTHRVIKN